MADEQQQLMMVLAAIIEEAGGEIWISAQTIMDLDESKKIRVEFHNDTEELKITFEGEEDNEL